MGLLQYTSNEMFSSTELVRKSKNIFDKLNKNEIEKAIVLRDGKPGIILLDFNYYEQIMAEYLSLKGENPELNIQKAKASKVVVKDIRFGPHTDEHDYLFKKNHAMKFLQDGCKVKAFVFFRGREIVFKEQGTILLLRFASELEEWGKAEQLPVLEGKKMLMVLAPKKAGK